MKYTQVSADAFKHLQLNAGILVEDFAPDTGTITNIVCATSGGCTFKSTPSWKDFAEDVDNVPANTKEMLKLVRYDAELSGTAVELRRSFIASLVATADVSGNKITVRNNVKLSDFDDLWWVGDYSEVNEDSGATVKAGCIAIHIMNALSKDGFQLQSENEGKGKGSFRYQAHYSISSIDTVPFEIYVIDGVSGT